MERIKNLDRFQKGILLLLTVMVLLFTVLYIIASCQEGYVYEDAFLRMGEENGNTVYTGELNGVQASFTVTPEKAVTFRFGDEVYGPYTAKKDPTAVPEKNEGMTGIELCRAGEVIFRGGVSRQNAGWFLMPEDGDLSDTIVIGIASQTPEPSHYAILDLMAGPELTHRGTWLGWITGTFLCLLTAPTILFADELFRFRMSFRVENADNIEPADWEIIGRYISWTVAPIAALVTYIIGLM